MGGPTPSQMLPHCDDDDEAAEEEEEEEGVYQERGVDGDQNNVEETAFEKRRWEMSIQIKRRAGRRR